MPVADTLWQILNIWSNISSVGGNFVFFLILWIVIIWILGIIWVAKDANARILNIFLQTVCILLATILWPLGVILYKIFRPVHYLSAYQIEKALIAMISAKRTICLTCWTINPLDHLFCHTCGKAIKDTCKECNHSIRKDDDYCGHCWAPNV